MLYKTNCKFYQNNHFTFSHFKKRFTRTQRDNKQQKFTSIRKYLNV